MVTMLNYLAIDAGGTSTRAVLLTASGECLGYGTAGGGNPISRGFDGALESLLEASRIALRGAPQPIAKVVMGMAGASMDFPTLLFQSRFATLGLTGEVVIESDLLAAFYSGTYQDDGFALIAGTGAVAASISSAHLDSVADGTGWLLGDLGSGFWIGQEVVRAVAAALDGRGRATALTAQVLADLQIPLDPLARSHGRISAQQQLIAKIYALRPIEISRFAPLVFTDPADAVSVDIIDRAGAALAHTLIAVMDGNKPGPLVFGGSVLTKGGTVSAAVMATLARAQGVDNQAITAPVMVADGVVGAAVLALKRGGELVDGQVFERINRTLAQLRD